MKNKPIKHLFILTLIFSAIAMVTYQVQAWANESSSNNKLTEKQQKEVYKPATFKNFSKTFWRFSKFDIDDNVAIDNYMKINECDLYKEYIHNEFEWDGIREATRNFLIENKKKFPAQYNFIQEISLGDYDFENKGFTIYDEHIYKGVKRFQINSDSVLKRVCGDKHKIEGYPKGIALELTRPLILDFFPMEENLGREMIAKKMEEYEKFKDVHKTKKRAAIARTVYLSAKVKMFAYKDGDVKVKDSAYRLAKMLGILERIEIYEDQGLTNLLYAKDYRRKKHNKKKDF